MRTKTVVGEPTRSVVEAVEALANNIKKEARSDFKVIASGITQEPTNEQEALYFPWAIFQLQ